MGVACFYSRLLLLFCVKRSMVSSSFPRHFSILQAREKSNWGFTIDLLRAKNTVFLYEIAETNNIKTLQFVLESLSPCLVFSRPLFYNLQNSVSILGDLDQNFLIDVCFLEKTSQIKKKRMFHVHNPTWEFHLLSNIWQPLQTSLGVNEQLAFKFLSVIEIKDVAIWSSSRSKLNLAEFN